MFRRCTLLILFIALISSLGLPSVQAEDGIPDNCEYLYGEYYHPNTFPRYEPQNRRLVLVDWENGSEVAVLDTNLDDTLIQTWSGNCRYLAVSTGSYESRSTIVYDTVDMHRVGSVPGAHAIPHPLTWGPNEFLMVEGRNGAVLWNVPLNIQYPLDVGYNEISYRNFSRLRWDAENMQVIANLAVGGRAVYDLRTGQQTTLFASGPGEILVGGERFQCVPQHGGHGGAAVSNLSPSYTPDGGVVYLRRGGESLQPLEANIPAVGLRPLGWSANCRYLAWALASLEQEDTYETVIWDMLEGHRVGSFPDAHDLPHYLIWDTAEKYALIETRNGAYLWNLLTDERTLVTSTIKEPPFDCRYEECQTHSFEHVYWDAGREQMLGVPVQTPNAVVAYDVNTGAEVTRYTVDSALTPLDFITSNDSRLLVAYADQQITLWDRETGVSQNFFYDGSNRYFDFSMRSAISTDNHFLAIYQGQTLMVWDLTAESLSASPTYQYKLSDYRFYGFGIYFINGDTLDSGNTYASVRVNVLTGEVFGGYNSASLDTQVQLTQNYAAVPGTSGPGIAARATNLDCPLAARYEQETRQLIVRDTRTDIEQVIEADLNNIRTLYLSPDCQTIYAEIQPINTSLPYDETPANAPYGYSRYRTLIFWDIATHERITTLDNPPLGKHRSAGIRWNPDGNRALVGTGNGYYIIHPASRSVAPVQFQDTDIGYLPGLLDSFWDHERGIVLVAGYGEVFAIDMQSGLERLRFPVGETRRGGCYYWSSKGCSFDISDDGNWVFVFGNESMSAWNIDTLANATLPVESGSNGTGALISPDGHFLVVSRSAIRVWDLMNLPEAFDARTPIATYGVGDQAVLSVHFVDNQTLEVLTRTTDGTATILYDVATGTPR